MLEAEEEVLFAAPRESFVAERQRLARALKQSGRAKEAAELARIPKPTLAAWVVNQLARQRRPLVKQLGAAGARLREVQLGTGAGISGGAEGRQAFTQAVAAQREALTALRAAAQELLTAAGHAAPPRVLEAILRTLRAGGASDIAQATIEQGRLLREIEEQDLGALASALPAAGPFDSQPALARPAAEKPVKGVGAAPEAEAARARSHAAEAQARAAAQARARARADAQREVTERQRAAEKAAQEQNRYQDEVTRARAILADAERRLAAARAAADSATGQLEEAQRRLRDLPS